MIDAIGWLAAATFPLSYFCKRELTLVSVQIVAATLWIGYGVGLQSKPVIGANIVVVACASFKAWRLSRAVAIR